jgi:hypothetical protein
MKIALVVTAIFASIVLVFFSDVIFGKRVLITCNPALYDPWHYYADQDRLETRSFNPDALFSYLPRRTELSLSIGEGRIPLWNPYILCGTPFLADPQNRVLYPISLILVPLDPARAVGYEIAVHVFLALVGMYIFLRIVGACTYGGVLGALAYGFSSFLFSRMGHPTFLASASWIPFMFYGYEKGLRQERTGTILLTFFLVMGYLAGFPQVLLFGVLGLFLYAAWGSLEALGRRSAQQLTRSVRILAVSGVLSVLVVSAQLIPFWEFVGNSAGLGYDFETMARIYISPPVLLIRAIVPNFFGNPADGTSWLVLLKRGGPPAGLGLFVYCGVGTALLVCGSLALANRFWRIRALLVLLVLSVGLGVSTLLLRVGYAVLPFIEFSKIDRVAVLACFAMSALGGITFSVIYRSEERRVRKWFSRIVWVAVVAALGMFITFAAVRGTAAEAFLKRAESFQPRRWENAASYRVDEWLGGEGDSWLDFEMREIRKAALFLGLSGVLLLLLTRRRLGSRRLRFGAGALFVLCLLSDVALTARGYYVTQPGGFIPETESIRLLRQFAERPGEWRTARYERKSPALPPNAGQVFRIPCLKGRSTMIPDACPTFYRSVSRRDGKRAGFGIGGELGDDAYRLACARYILSPYRGPKISSKGWRLVHDKDMRIYENADALEKGICLRKAGLSVVEVAGQNVLEVYDALTSPEVARCGKVHIALYEPERVVVDVHAAESCFLIFQDNFYPGWKAYVDGEEGEILRTDIGFRAVELEEGVHTVVMRFRPRSFRLGIFVSCVGLIACLILIWKPRFRDGITSP